MNAKLLAISLAAFAVTANTAFAAPKDDLLAADRAFSQVSVDKGSNAAFLAYMADDAHIFGTGSQPPIHGKAEAIERFKTSSNGDPKLNVLRWEPETAELSKDGMLGWTDGHWIFESGPNDAGRRMHITGHYLTVWRKDASGAWKFVADMGTTDPAAEKKK
jgi:ketosteroid isomerase-like protein